MEQNPNEIFKTIREQGVTMRPKAYFALKTALVALAGLALLLFIVYLVSFTIFSLRASGAWFLPGLGMAAIPVLFGSLPWVLIVLCIALVVALEVFAEHLPFVYRRPMMYSLGGIVIVVLAGGLLVDQFQLHEIMFRNSQDRSIPVISGLYREYAAPKTQKLCHGIVEELNQEGFVMETMLQESVFVHVLPRDIFPRGVILVVGDRVLAIGQRAGNTMYATAVQRIDQPMDIFPRKARMK